MPGDQYIVSASRDKTIRVFDVASTWVQDLLLVFSLSINGIVATKYGRSLVTQNGFDGLRLPRTAKSSLAAPKTKSVSFSVRSRSSLRPLTANRTLFPQTIRIWDPLTGEQKAELRGHENDVEVVVFAPVAAYAAIRELTGIPVRKRQSEL
jgi:platelet-activating factor acetylhydrolase IB subunit alpha